MLTSGLNNYVLVMHIGYSMIDVPHICQKTLLKLQIFIDIILEGVVKTLLYLLSATTFYYSAIKVWNSIPSGVKIWSNYNSFKGDGKAYLRTQLQLSEAISTCSCTTMIEYDVVSLV